MLVDASLLPQLTLIVPVPGRVPLPMVHDQETRPVPSVVCGPSPAAALGFPSGVVYWMVQRVFGAAVAVTVAL